LCKYQNVGVLPAKSDVSPKPALISLSDNSLPDKNDNKTLKKTENEKNLISQLENMKFSSKPNFDLD
jgi:hypothetical protein